MSVRQETQKEVPENVSLDVYLMNGHKISISIVSTDQTEDILEVGRCVNTLVNVCGVSVVRAFAPKAGGRGFDPRPLHIKDVIKMVPDASLLGAQHINIGLASLSSQTSFKK